MNTIIIYLWGVITIENNKIDMIEGLIFILTIYKKKLIDEELENNNNNILINEIVENINILTKNIITFEKEKK